jgi:hypothetical protein
LSPEGGAVQLKWFQRIRFGFQGESVRSWSGNRDGSPAASNASTASSADAV